MAHFHGGGGFHGGYHGGGFRGGYGPRYYGGGLGLGLGLTAGLATGALLGSGGYGYGYGYPSQTVIYEQAQPTQVVIPVASQVEFANLAAANPGRPITFVPTSQYQTVPAVQNTVYVPTGY
jgi:hypothetical protein